MSKYRYLFRKNEWGNLSFFVGPKGPAFVFPAEHAIKFKDGTIETVKVWRSRVTEHINDMGHEYTVTSDAPMITLTVHGNKIPVRLDEVGVQVRLP